MRLGIFAKTFEGENPFDVFAAVAEAGYSATQYNMSCSGLAPMPDAIDIATAKRVGEASARIGVTNVAVSGTYNMIHPDATIRAAGHRRLDVLAARCNHLSTRLITLCTGTRDPLDQWKWHPDNHTPEAWRDLLDAMAIAIEIAERHDVDLGIEPELANVVNSAERARRLIDELKSPRLKIVFDPANLFDVVGPDEQHYTISAAIDLLADRIVLAHAKDRQVDGSFTTAGKGVLDYAHYLGCLKRAHFGGSIVAHGLSAEEAPGVARFLTGQLAAIGMEAAQ